MAAQARRLMALGKAPRSYITEGAERMPVAKITVDILLENGFL